LKVIPPPSPNTTSELTAVLVRSLMSC